MATDIVGSLFGVTPEMLQQRQFEMADRQALEYAQLSPLQRASYGLARSGYQLAGALGGEDPQLRMISNRNAIARQIDPTDPNSMRMGIQALQQAGDSVGAMQLAQVLRQAESELAKQFQSQAAGEASLASARRERVQASPEKLQIAREYAATFGEEGTPEYINAFRASLRGEEKAEKPVVVGNALVNPTTGAVIYQSPSDKLNTAVVGGNLVDTATGRVIFSAPEQASKPVVVGNALVDPTSGSVIYQSPSDKLNTAVVGGNLVDTATGRVIFAAPTVETKPVVVGNALVDPNSGREIYKADAKAGTVPASVLEYQFAQTDAGGNFKGTFDEFLATKGRTTVAQPADVSAYEFAKTPQGGGFKGTFLDFVMQRSAAGRAPVQPVAPTITQIQDPTDPTKMITIDARRYQGGGMGSPGVIGSSGKTSAAAAADMKREEGQTRAADIIDNLRGAYVRLDQLRAIPSERRNVISNTLAGIAATGPGQVAGRLAGTEEQTQRDIIQSARNQLFAAVKDATGLSAQNLNSNVEFTTWLNSLTDPSRSIEANKKILDELERFITGANRSANRPATGAGGGAANAPRGTAANPIKLD